MARSTAIDSSLPQVQDEVDEDTEQLGEEEEDEFDADAEAQAEGYASAAEKAQYETQARKAHWKPLEEYRGEPGKWVNAKEFVERGNNFLPFVKKERDELRNQVGSMQAEIAEMRNAFDKQSADMQKLLEFTRNADKRAYDKALADLKAEQREAVAAGDTATFDEKERQIAAMEEERDNLPADEDEPAPTRRQPVDPNKAVYDAFVAENPWFAKDPVLNPAMIAAHNEVMQEYPGMPLAEQLETAKEEVMKRHPKKFGRAAEPAQRQEESANQPPPRRPAAPLKPRGGGNGPTAKTGIDAIEDPRERSQARAGFNQAKKSMPDLTEAEYLQIFNNPHGDVLEVVGKKRGK